MENLSAFPGPESTDRGLSEGLLEASVSTVEFLSRIHEHDTELTSTLQDLWGPSGAPRLVLETSRSSPEASTGKRCNSGSAFEFRMIRWNGDDVSWNS